MPYIFAAISALTMGLFYILDMFFESRGVYARPAQAMIISSLVPLLSVPFFMLSSAWQLLPTPLLIAAVTAGACLIWANWFYFLVMFPVDKDNRDADAVEGATELALYEGTTPAVVLMLSLIVSQFIVYTDTISVGQGLAVILTVFGLVLFATADGYQGFTRWSYRCKLICFAALAAVSQLIQDLVVNYLQSDYGFTTYEAYVSTASFVWVGMFSGILIAAWRQEGRRFWLQWQKKIKHYIWLVLVAEVIAIASYAALIGSYTGAHVAVSGAIAASFPIVVFIGGLLLQRWGVQEGSELANTKHLTWKFCLIILTLLGVAGVVLF